MKIYEQGLHPVVASALLATFQGGVSVEHAIGVFTSSWATGMLEEAWSHGVKGKPHASAKVEAEPVEEKEEPAEEPKEEE